MKPYEVIRGRRYNADATMAVPELTRNSFYICCNLSGGVALNV